MIVKNLGRVAFVFLLPLFLYAEVKFEVKLSKDKIYINETIKADLVLSVSNDEKIDQTYFEEFETSDFWIKRLEDIKPIKGEENTIYRYQFLLEPKVVGSINLDKQFVEISSKKLRANFKRWHKIYSKERLIEVYPLYEDLAIQGKYTIELKADKTKIKANEPINITLKIKGKGNIDDIKKFDLGFKDKIVYSDLPNISSKFEMNSYWGEFIQKFSIIADKSFSIPSIKFKYLNIDTNSMEIIFTKPIFIEVQELVKDTNDPKYLKYIFAIFGVFIGVILVYIVNFIRKKQSKKQHPLEIQIKKAKSDKELYNLLLTISRDIDLDDLMKKLEENIYNGAKNKIDKKEILKCLH